MKKKKGSAELTAQYYKLRGSYLKPFQSFYGAKQYEKSMNDVERVQIERRLRRSLEEKIKELRDNVME